MHCFDCAEQNVDRSAVGTCMDCGAGVCAKHARPEGALSPAGWSV